MSFRPHVKGEPPTLVGPLERANFNHCSFQGNQTEYVSPPTKLRTETDPVSETLCFLVL
jgi:hypothetical protein